MPAVSMISKGSHVLATDLGYRQIPDVLEESSKLRHGGVPGLLSLPLAGRPLLAFVVI